MLTIKRLSLITVLFAVSTVTWAQNIRVKDIRQTYLWDVTLSMQGKGVDQNGNKNPNIWEIVKDALVADIEAIQDESTEIVVIPFQHKVLETNWREPATQEGKQRMIKRIRQYQIPYAYTTANGKKTTMTFLGPSLEYCMNNVFTPDKIDILKFMTDGVDEQDIIEPQNAGYYHRVLKQWCDNAREKDAYGYLILLTDAAKVGWDEFKENHEEMCRWHPTPDATTDISGFITIAPQESIAFNIRDDYAKPIKIKFNHSGNGSIPEGYKVHIKTWTNEYMEFDEEVTLHGNVAEINPKYLKSREDMDSMLPTDRNEIIYFQVEEAEGMDIEPFCRTMLISNPTSCELINKPEMTVKFHVR